MLSRVQMNTHSALHTAKLSATAACIPAKQKVRTLMEIRNISDIDISHFQSPDSGVRILVSSCSSVFDPRPAFCINL